MADDPRQARFDALYLAYHRDMHAYALRRVGPDAPDVVAEVFAVAWRRLDVVPAAPADRLWLYGVARRCVDRARRTDRRRWRLHARLADEARRRPAEADGGSSGREAWVREAIGRLPATDREVLMLLAWDGLTHAEAAHVLGCSVNAVAQRAGRARRRLRDALSAGEPSSELMLNPDSGS